jgi:ABC-type branched-subunit amino acid transport system substrate-binding protein
MAKRRKPRKKKEAVTPSATPSSPEHRPASDRGKTPLRGDEEKAPESPTHWIMQLIWKSPYRKSILTVIAVVMLGVAAYPALIWLRELLPHMHPFPTNPVVISIQPVGEFGDLRADGLTRGLSTTASLGIVRISADIADMKARRVDGLLQELRKRLTEHNAVAVVGPSISECTVDVLDCVQSSGVKVPVIIESSSPREPLAWNDRPFPLFRLSSGIDERAVEVAEIARRLVDSGGTVAFLIERVANAESYGELLYRHTRSHLDASTLERIQIHYFDHLHAGDVVNQPQIAELFASDAVIFLLGLGNDFHSVMDAFLQAESRPARARLVGVMCAYKTAPSLLRGHYRRSQILELTDVSPMSQGLTGRAREIWQNAYRSGPFDPRLRDQAFSFDAGICLVTAMQDVLRRRTSEPDMTYEDTIAHVASWLMSTALDGASGKIAFRDAGNSRGQNVGSALQLVRMDAEGRWAPVSIEQILEPPSP